MKKYTLLKNKLTGDRAIYVSAGKDKTGFKVCENVNKEEYARLRKLAIANIRVANKNQCMKDLGLVSYRNESGALRWE